jgi:hypothetical protein
LADKGAEIMAYGAEPAGADTLAHTIHIWPSQELIARSWSWSEAWHAAYEQAASEVGRAVAVCVLGGLSVSEQPIAMELPAGYVSFSVSLWGTSIQISITAFEGPGGPDAPGPDGGCRQPRPADGLVLGLRGTGKCFALVTFYGYLPPLPAGCNIPARTISRAFARGDAPIGDVEIDTSAYLKYPAQFPIAWTRQRADAGLAGIVAHAPKFSQSRAVIDARSGIAFTPHLASVGNRQSRNRADEEWLRDAVPLAPRGSWVAGDGSHRGDPTEMSPFERLRHSDLH